MDSQLKDQIRSYFEKLRQDVVLAFHPARGAESDEMLAELTELSGLSSRITLTVLPPAEGVRAPAVSIGRASEDGRVTFAGMPEGHEVTSLILAILHAGGHPPREDADVLAQIRGLDAELHFETYYSATCQNCPDVIQALNLMATQNPKISHTAIDGAVFEAEVTAQKIMAVPTVYLNGERFWQGRMDLAEILSRVDISAQERERANLAKKGVFDVLIVGAGPAGAAAAIYAARKGIATGIVAERFGGQVLDTLAIENFVSIPETEGPKFAAALESHVRAYPVDVMKNQRVARLLAPPGGPICVELESGAVLKTRTAILAPGARWRDMNVPGEAEYRTRGVTYCPHCDGPLFKGKRVAVIGGGNSGVEAAIDLAGVVEHVTLLEFAPELKADAVLVRKLLSMRNVDVITSARTTEVRGDGERVVGLSYEDRASGELRELAVAGVFVQIGLLPSTDFLRGTVELSQFGEIVVDDHGRTSLDGVFAAGDATTVPYKQIIIATGDGAKAALGAFDYLIRVTAPAA